MSIRTLFYCHLAIYSHTQTILIVLPAQGLCVSSVSIIASHHSYLSAFGCIRASDVQFNAGSYITAV